MNKNKAIALFHYMYYLLSGQSIRLARKVVCRLDEIPTRSKTVLLFLVLLLVGIPRLEKGNRFKGAFQSQSEVGGVLGAFFYSEEELQYIDHQITNLLIDNRFNGNILIARYGMLIYERSFGFSSFRKAEPVTSSTTFQLASISKTFTSAAVLLLHHRGMIDINHKVKEYIPEFPYEDITIRHMLTHTSGLQNYMWQVERHWRKRAIPDNEDVLQLFLNHPRPLNFFPGQRFDYSNTGYVFLALLIERVSGESFGNFIHANIFDPLQMDRSFVNDLNNNPPEMENRAYGYRQWRGQHILIPDDHLDGPLGDKGIFSTVHDLYKWDQALHRSELLPAELWQKAFAHATLSNDSLINYGLGWRLQYFLDKRIVHHPGRWHGFRTSFKRFVDDHTTIIVLSNNNRSILPVIEGIQNIIYYDEKEIWLAARDEAQEREEQTKEDAQQYLDLENGELPSEEGVVPPP